MNHHGRMRNEGTSGAGKLKGLAEAFKPNKASAGYALFLAINATAVWGGVFPFLPEAIQTAQIMFWFFLAEALAFAAAFVASIVGSYFLPSRTKRFLVITASLPYLAGWACLIAAVYVDSLSLPLATVGGALLGLGSAGYYMIWQRLFAGTDPGKGTHDLIVGTAYASVAYFALYLIPQAVTAFLVPLVFLPLFGLAATLSSRKVDLDQPMFEDVPREHPQVYRRAVADVWRSALCLGSVGLSTGIMRASAITDPSAGAMVNIISMGSSLVVSVALVLLWTRHSIRINVIDAYRFVFPVLLTMFVAMPFVPVQGLRWLAGSSYALNGVGILLMMIQCAQISRDRGINPVFIYGFFGGIMYMLHDLGFIAGTVASHAIVAGLSSTAVVALVAVYALGILFLVGQKRGDEEAARFSDGNSIELVAVGRALGAGGTETDSADTAAASAGAPGAAGAAAKKASLEASTGTAGASADTAGEAGDSESTAATASAAENTTTSVSDTAKDQTPDISDAGDHKHPAQEKKHTPLAPETDSPEAKRNRTSGHAGGRASYTDRISKQVSLMKVDFGLSTREAEVAELLARGETVARIAETLFVSENTVRTHSKRIYAKLDVHKKQQLRDLVSSYEP